MCCVYATMAIDYCSTKYPISVAEVSEAMYGNKPIFTQSFITFCQRQGPPLSDFYHISSVWYIGVSLPHGSH